MREQAPSPASNPNPNRNPELGPGARPPAPPPLVIGVLGGIASGKSAAARLIAGLDGLVLDADRIAHEALASDEVTALVAERFGLEALDPSSGRPDRARLAKIAFEDPEARRSLERWIHPRVRDRIRAELDAARERGIPRVVLDVPLLLENAAEPGLARRCHVLVFVDADDRRREERAIRRRGWSQGEVARRESAQLPLGEKRRRADFVLSNRGSEQDLERAVPDLLESAAFRACVTRAGEASA